MREDAASHFKWNAGECLNVLKMLRYYKNSTIVCEKYISKGY